jgi:hypothetical protein
MPISCSYIKIRQSFWTLAFFFTSLLLCTASTAFSQVATSSLDPTEKALMPAAISWRFSSTIGAAVYANGTGEYKNSQGDKTSELTRSGLEGLIAHQFEEITVEYSNTLEFKEIQKDLSTDEESTYKSKFDRLNLAYRFSDSASIGAVYRTWKKESDYTNTIGREYETGAGEKTALGFGGSIRLLDFFFLAAGVEEITHQQNGFDENKWMDQMLGLGLLGEGVFRLEVAKIVSPESDTTGAVPHAATDDVIMSVEIKLATTWLLRYQKEEYVVKPIGTGNDAKYEYTTIGVGFVPDEGLVFGIAMITGKQDENFSSTDYRLSMGWNYW